MQTREKTLAIVVATVVLLLLAYKGFDWYSTELASLDQQVVNLQKLVTDKEIAKRKLLEWNHRSLPKDQYVGRSLYQKWLFGLSDHAKLTDFTLTTNMATLQNQGYDKLTCTVGAHGTIEQVTQFLFDFYGTNHLHQIRKMTIKPLQNSKRLAISMTIEALKLPNADREDGLNADKKARTELSDFAAYKDSIVKRNLFSEYVPPPPPVVARVEKPRDPPPAPPAPPPPPKFDVAKFAYVTAIMDVDREPEVWLHIRTTNKTLRLHEGEPFEVEGFKGQITKIGEREVEFKTGNKRMTLNLGENLRAATAADEL